jgi:chorismate mutase-like protein
MNIEDWRRKIDELDRKLVKLINQRAQCAQAIGQLKRNSEAPVYEPDRERVIFENIARENTGPLSQVQLRQVYERLVDVMRQIQREEMAPQQSEQGDATELEPND